MVSKLHRWPGCHFNNTTIMGTASFIFWAIFVLPLVAFLIWLMRQDKKKGTTGLFVLILGVIGAIIYMYARTGGK
ncbi:MAG: KUP/HAK/KT family potassium transporter [Janthinobacterium lividum]